MKRETLKEAFLSSVPVLTGYITLGIAFGILLRTAGYGLFWALGMSIFIFAGSLQFVGIGLLTSGASLLSVALTALLVNARHLFYGLSMIDRYKDMGAMKPYVIFSLTDETYSLVCTGHEDWDPVQRKWYYFLVSLFDQCYWVTGSVLGVLFGAILPFDTTGIDFAMTALFVCIVTEQWLGTRNHFPALVGAAATTVCLLLFGGQSFLIPSMGLIAAILLGSRHSLKTEKEDMA